MTRLTIHIGALAMASLLAAGCSGGGTSEPFPAEGDVSTAIDTTATDAAAELTGDGWQDMQSNWQNSIGNIKDRWAELTEEDLLMVNGDREQLVSLVQEKYGLDRETAESEVADWAASL